MISKGLLYTSQISRTGVSPDENQCYTHDKAEVIVLCCRYSQCLVNFVDTAVKSFDLNT